MGFIIGDLTSALASFGAARSEYKENLDLFKVGNATVYLG